MSSQEIAFIILQVVFIATFIGIFFFTYISQIEQNVVKNQMQYIVTELLSDYSILTPPNYKAEVRKYLSTVTPPDMTQADAEAAATNKALLIQAAKVLGALVVVGVGVAYFLAGPAFKSLVMKTLMVLIFIALTEYMFATYIAQNYRSADPNYVKLQFVTALESAANS